MSEEIGQKDWWDKAEILSKLIGSLLIPVIVAVSVWAWNSERTLQQTASTMTQIAVGVLTGPPSPETQPLRAWAISVLQAPDAPPALSREAAFTLQGTELAVWGSTVATAKGGANWRSYSSSRLQKIRDDWASSPLMDPELEGQADSTTFQFLQTLIEDIDAELNRRGQ
jgi:hypothetical protein